MVGQMIASSHSKNGTSGGDKLYCVDLFAGCGGLSLGLEMVGFTPLLFNELSLDAAKTYMVNRKGLDIFPSGDIYQLTDLELKIKQEYWRQRGISDIDLVCGGPPCQGYSGIGHRRTFDLNKEDIPSNQLFKEMIRVIRCLQPKIFLFENVRGLLNSRWTPGAKKGGIFRDVVAGFNELQGYRIKWDLVYAKDYGVPQNRPRVLMVGIRQDIFESAGFDEHLGNDTSLDGSAVEDGFLPASKGVDPPTIVELLSDLVDPRVTASDPWVRATEKYPLAAKTDVQRWLRTPMGEGKPFARGAPLTQHEYSRHRPEILDKFQHMIDHDGDIPEKYRTKKFAQRVLPREWPGGGPNITATSLPDDYVHYSQPRAPTVREWARIQTFPDWYEFCGPRTTGGRRRAGDPDADIWDRDVPKFTQIGNAVPVLLARAVGKHFKDRILAGDRAPVHA